MQQMSSTSLVLARRTTLSIKVVNKINGIAPNPVPVHGLSRSVMLQYACRMRLRVGGASECQRPRDKSCLEQAGGP